MKLVGLSGRLGSGKDTIGTYIRSEFTTSYRVSFGDAVKEVCYAAFGGNYQNYFGTQEDKDQEFAFWKQHLGESYSTYRRIMQTLGTDIFRQHIHSDFWVLKATQKILSHNNENCVVTVTDVRFDNEAELIKRLGGLVIEVVNLNQGPNRSEHASEQGISPDLVDFQAASKSLDECRETAKSIADFLKDPKGSTRILAV